MNVPLSSIIGDLEVEELELGDGEIIIDAFVIVRSVKPDRDNPMTAYTATVGLFDDAIRLGILDIVASRIRTCSNAGWEDDA